MTSTNTTTESNPTRAAAISGTLGLFAGSFFANGVPHTVFGLTGMEHSSPFGTAASVNLAWGLANLAIGVVLAAPRPARRAYVPFTIGAAAGALGVAVSLIVLWS